MPTERSQDLSLFVDILHTLEETSAPYVIIGAFAGIVYGVNRTTYDIDIVVDLREEHIQALASRYPSPRFYADPEQMRNSIRMGIMFNIIDGSRGEKADLMPVTRHPEYRRVLANRVRQLVATPGVPPFEAWCARSEDVIIGKLNAWAEGRSRKHETDIYQMLVFYYLGLDPTMELDEFAVGIVASQLGSDVASFWAETRQEALEEAERQRNNG